jgi:hypothetical protein
MNPNTIPIIWVGFIGAVPLLLFVGAPHPAVFSAIVSFVVLAVVVATYLAPAIIPRRHGHHNAPCPRRRATMA